MRNMSNFFKLKLLSITWIVASIPWFILGYALDSEATNNLYYLNACILNGSGWLLLNGTVTLNEQYQASTDVNYSCLRRMGIPLEWISIDDDTKTITN